VYETMIPSECPGTQ